MIEFPGTEQDVQKLERFLTETENLPATAELDALRARAQAHAERLSNAVSIGFVGEFGAGKSSLANMLAGADILPTGPRHMPLPLVIVTYAEEPETTFGWPGKPPRTYAGVALDKAGDDKPDFISVGVNAPALREVSLFDLPGSGGLDDGGRQTLELLDFVDCVIWCTNGTSAWRESERHLWSRATAELHANSLLVVTHSDLPPVRESLDRVLGRLRKETSGLFSDVVAIGTPVAVRAMSKEPEPDFALWDACGGQKLAQAVLKLASERRQKDVAAARNDLESLFLPAMQDLAKPASPAPMPTPSGPSVQDRLGTALPPLTNPILEDWLAAITSIHDDMREAAEIDAAEFLNSCQEIVEEFAERLEGSGEIDPDADWIPAEFEKATDLLLLLQFESGNAPLKDAVYILMQLSDSLAWAGSRAAAIQSRTGT